MNNSSQVSATVLLVHLVALASKMALKPVMV